MRPVRPRPQILSFWFDVPSLPGFRHPFPSQGVLENSRDGNHCRARTGQYSAKSVGSCAVHRRTAAVYLTK